MKLTGWGGIAKYYNRDKTTVRGWIKDRDGNIKEGCPVFMVGRSHALETESFTPWLDKVIPGWRRHGEPGGTRARQLEAIKRREEHQQTIKEEFSRRMKMRVPNLNYAIARDIDNDISEFIQQITSKQ